MKKFVIISFVILVIAIAGLCFYYMITYDKQKNSENNLDKGKEQFNSSIKYKLKISFEDKEIIVLMENNKASSDLLKQLPLTLTFEDFSNTEKIAYLNKRLDYDKNGYKPKRGDLTYYAPWGNLAFFYKGGDESSNLIKLGEIESGLEYLDYLDGKTATLELMN